MPIATGRDTAGARDHQDRCRIRPRRKAGVDPVALQQMQPQWSDRAAVGRGIDTRTGSAPPPAGPNEHTIADLRSAFTPGDADRTAGACAR